MKRKNILISHSGIAQHRDFGSEDYELLLKLDEVNAVEPECNRISQRFSKRDLGVGLDEITINSFPFYKVSKVITIAFPRV